MNVAGKRSGRPLKDEQAALHDALLNHALAQFTSVGYRATTMAGIAAAAGSAKSTLFRKFGSKSGLLHATMQRGIPALLTPLEAVNSDIRRPPKDVLRDFGTIIQRYHADPGIRTMWRAVSEARDELGGVLEDSATQRAIALKPIATYFSTMMEAEQMAHNDPDAVAAAFAELVGGGLSAFLGPVPTRSKQHKVLDLALCLMIGGLAMESAPSQA